VRKETANALIDTIIKTAELLKGETVAEDSPDSLMNDGKLSNDNFIQVIRPAEITIGRVDLNDYLRFSIYGKYYSATAIKQETDSMLFCFNNCLSDDVPMFTEEPVNGGYDVSDLRKFLKKIENEFPANIKKRMIPFKNGDLLRIATCEEILDKYEFVDRSCEDLGGNQIPYFKNFKKRIALRDDEPEWYWMQNRIKGSPSYFAICYHDGRCGSSDPTVPHGVRPFFQIRNI